MKSIMKSKNYVQNKMINKKSEDDRPIKFRVSLNFTFMRKRIN